MSQEQTIYLKSGRAIHDAIESQMFGKPCFKTKEGKAFICLSENSMVFKLDEEVRKQVLALSGTSFFDPSGKNRPMKEWIQVPAAHMKKWPELARVSYDYVSSLAARS